MRIAHFIHRYPPAHGGAEAYMARLSEALVEAGHSVTVFTTTALELTAFWNRRSRQLPAGISWHNGVKIQRFPLHHLPAHRWILRSLSLIPLREWQAWTMWCSPFCPQMMRAVGSNSEPFDLVHGTALPYTWPLLAGQRLAQLQKIPLLLTPFVHLGDLDHPHNAIRKAYTRPSFLRLLGAAQRIFVQTPQEQRALQELGFSAEKLILQGMGIKTSAGIGGDRERFRQQWGIGPEQILIGHLANLSREKGTIDLLEAYRTGSELSGKAQLVLAGEQMPNFERYWSKNPSIPGVIRLGPLSEAEKEDFYAGIDLFVLPSRVDSFGMVILEAWTHRLPVIVYRAGGLPGVVRDGIDGTVVSCGKIQDLRATLLRLVNDPLLRQQQGAAGYQQVREHWTLDRSIQIVETTYRNLAKGSL